MNWIKPSRLTQKLLVAFYLAALAIGVYLSVVFVRFQSLQQEFLALNFDAVHSTRALLKTGLLVEQARGELNAAAAYRDPSRLSAALEHLGTAIDYERSAEYAWARNDQDLRSPLASLRSELATLVALQREGRALPAGRLETLAPRAERILLSLEDAERDGWGMLSALNGQLRERMRLNIALGLIGGGTFALIMVVLALALYRVRRAERLLLGEKRALEQEVRQRKETEQALRDASSRFRDLSELGSDWFWEQDAELRFRQVSSQLTSAVQLSEDMLIGRRRWELPGAQPLAGSWDAHRHDLQARRPFRDFVYQLHGPDGALHYLSISGKPLFDSDGRFLGYRGTARDITAQTLVEQTLFAEKERAEVTLASIADGVITTDAEGIITYLNPVAEDLTGWRADDARGRPLSQIFRLVDELTRQRLPDSVAEVVRTGEPSYPLGQRVLVRSNGSECPVEDSTAPMRDDQGKVTGVVLVFRDVSQTRRLARELSYHVSHDPLTGLVNRHEFERRLSVVLAGIRHEPEEHALLYLDLDQFKVVNDTCGHVAGDELLRQLVPVLKQSLRSSDTLARLGGDEFGVLLEGCPPEPAYHVAEKLRAAVQAFRFRWEEHEFSPGVSIGLVSFKDDSLSLTGILSMADAACYIAKDRGRNAIHVYHPDDQELARRHGEMEWLLKIQRALAEERLVLHQQAIVPVKGKIRGRHFEVLVRMLDEEGKVVPPGHFLPAAEHYDLMPSIDRWVVRAALSACRELLAQDAEAISLCAINLSGASLGDSSFLSYVREQFQAFAVPHKMICFEITETAAISNIGRAAEFVREMKALGCRFALDDFGSGMSSFGYLKHLPVDFLKIDGSFVKDMLSNESDQAVVRAIHQIGRVFGIRTVAEFVENEEILKRLAEIGVDYAQGYAIARPMPMDLPPAANGDAA